MAIRTLAGDREVVLSTETEVVSPLSQTVKVFLPKIGDGTGGTVISGTQIFLLAEAAGGLEVCDNKERRIVLMPPHAARMALAKENDYWTSQDAPPDYPYAHITDPPVGGGGGDPVATTVIQGVSKVDNNSAGNPVALTSAGHGSAADPHTQYALDSEKGAASGLATLDGSSLVPVAQLPIATTAARGVAKVDNNSAGDPVALTSSGHGAAADPHPQYALDSEKGALSGIATLDGSGKLTAAQLPLGSSGTTAAAGNDSRLSDARTPTAHAASHQHGGSDEVAVAVPAANAIPKAGAANKLDIGWIPTGSTGTTVPFGNDARFSDARTPTAHHTSHEPGGSDPMAVDAAAATGSLRTLGTGAAQAAAGNDSRLSDARTPTAHATTHKSGGSDAIRLDEFAAPTASVGFNGQQATSFRVENRTSDPGSPAAGQIWLRTDL
jgi:hypothetical protein